MYEKSNLFITDEVYNIGRTFSSKEIQIAARNGKFIVNIGKFEAF